MKPWMLLPLLVLGSTLAHADLYRWVDAEGKVHYTDQPPPPSVKQVERKKLGDKPADPALPYSLQVAVKNFPVTLYVSDCGDACKHARALLAKRGVPYTEKDPGDTAIYEELKKVNGGSAEVPVMQVGRRVLRGFEEGQWNSALDIAGYPSTALIPPPAPKKPKPAAKPAAGEQDNAPEAPAPGQN